jgi:hypothetical protein
LFSSPDVHYRTGVLGKKWSFGSAPRFSKPGLEFISSEHARSNVGQIGPGPCGYSVRNDDVGFQKVTARTSMMMWVP